MSNPKVFVTQRHMIRGPDRTWVDKYDLTTAKDHGELIYLTSSQDQSKDIEAVIRKMEAQLVDFKDDDFLLLIGNPMFIGVATALAAMFNSNVNFLQWSNRDREYTPYGNVLINHPD